MDSVNESNSHPESSSTQQSHLNNQEAQIESIIRNHIGYAMVAGIIPVPIMDIAAITGVQLDMISRLAKKYDVDFDAERGRIFIGSLVGASAANFLGRIGSSMLKIIPGIGTVLGMSSQALLAGASTYALGRLFQRYFEEGKDLLDFDVERIRADFDSLVNRGKEVVKQMKPTSDPVQSLEKLQEMHDKGLINAQEYAKSKAEILKRL
jgi:uncharacterized protein (DUF697 family)